MGRDEEGVEKKRKFYVSSRHVRIVCPRLKDAMHTWLRSQRKTFFADGIRKLVNCYKVCVEKSGLTL
jgi:hypothetical protein